MKHNYRFDNINFNKEELKTYINNNRKLLLLYNKIRSLDDNFKHVIYTSSTSCAKILCG